MGRFQYEGNRYTLYDDNVEKLLLRTEDMKYELRHGIYEREQNITVDKWFWTWMEEYKKPTVKLTTYELYERTYESHIKPYFKGKKLKDIHAEHIQRLLKMAPLSGAKITEYVALCEQRYRYVGIFCPNEECNGEFDAAIMDEREWNMHLQYANIYYKLLKNT